MWHNTLLVGHVEVLGFLHNTLQQLEQEHQSSLAQQRFEKNYTASEM